MDAHYIALIPAYFTASGLWLLINHFYKAPWKYERDVEFNKPWLEFLYAILAGIVIIGIGQLYVHDLLIPDRGNTYLDAFNQILIFSPTILLVLIRKQKAETLWLPKSRIHIRLAAGFIIAFVSLFVYWIFRRDAAGFSRILLDIFHPKNISYLVQVFMEDLTIALLFVRLSAWIGRKNTIVIVALLFAAGHIPALLSEGATLVETGSLFIDAFIGVIIISVVSRSRDIWWFFILHFALDMTQFYGGVQ